MCLVFTSINSIHTFVSSMYFRERMWKKTVVANFVWINWILRVQHLMRRKITSFVNFWLWTWFLRSSSLAIGYNFRIGTYPLEWGFYLFWLHLIDSFSTQRYSINCIQKIIPLSWFIDFWHDFNWLGNLPRTW